MIHPATDLISSTSPHVRVRCSSAASETPSSSRGSSDTLRLYMPGTPSTSGPLASRTDQSESWAPGSPARSVLASV